MVPNSQIPDSWVWTDGELRSKVFYCNPAAPNEKGACEVNHEFIRRIIPKGVDIGQYTQDDIDLMMNNINSYSRPELGNKPPYAIFSFFYGKKVLKAFNFEVIKPNDIILRPSLLKKTEEKEWFLVEQEWNERTALVPIYRNNYFNKKAGVLRSWIIFIPFPLGVEFTNS